MQDIMDFFINIKLFLIQQNIKINYYKMNLNIEL